MFMSLPDGHRWADSVPTGATNNIDQIQCDKHLVLHN